MVSQNVISQQVQETMLQTQQQELSFRVVQVVLKNVTASNEDIRNHALRLAQKKAEELEFTRSQAMLKLKTDVEFANRERERKEEVAHAEAKATADHTRAVRLAELDSKRRKEEDATKIRLAEIMAQAELDKFKVRESQNNMKLIKDVLLNREQQDLMRQIISRQHGITFSQLPHEEAGETNDSTAEAADKSSTPPSSPKPSAEGDGSDQPG